ncbi:hypothetical protein JW823_09650 [bacterium]|nr:hypothetical protein [candidate division CSSED10-310 bacterium]
MSTINKSDNDRSLNRDNLDTIFRLLDYRLKENHSNPVEIVVCGGTALIRSGLVTRTTKDVDIVALAFAGTLLSPDPLPDKLVKASTEVADDLGLPAGWLNNGPSRNDGGLFQMGLPDGLAQRLQSKQYGSRLTVHFINRIDQIFFKLYASADRGGYHIQDLLSLTPDRKEIEAAARWAMTHDVSEGFAAIMKQLLVRLGYEDVSEKL